MGAADVTTLARASADWLTGRASALRLPVPLELEDPMGQAAAQAAGPGDVLSRCPSDAGIADMPR